MSPVRPWMRSCRCRYVALAEALDVPLLTSDRSLAKTAVRYCAVVVL